MKPNQILGLGLIFIGLLFLINLFGMAPVCIGGSVFLLGCVGLSIPPNLVIGLVLVPLGGAFYLRMNRRRGTTTSLRALGLLLILIAIIGFVGASSTLSILGSPQPVIQISNFPLILAVFAIFGGILYLKGGKRR